MHNVRFIATAIALVCLLSSPANTTVAASVGVTAYATPNPGFVGQAVHIKFEKRTTELDGPQVGEVRPLIEGPESIELRTKDYNIEPVQGPESEALWWSWTPTRVGTYKILLDDSPTVGREMDRSISISVSGRVGAGFNDGEDLFGFGDSLTVAKTSPLSSDGSDSYVHQLRDLHFPSLSVDHNMDGSGKASSWAVANIDSYRPSGRLAERNGLFLMEFGINDRRPDRGNLSPAQTVENLAATYDIARQFAAQVLVATPIVVGDCGVWYDEPSIQLEWISQIEQGLLARGMPFLKLYDSLDSMPYNGRPDAWVSTHMIDCVHPNESGNRIMADFIAFFINGRDKVMGVDERSVISIRANYNQTILVPAQDAWAGEEVGVRDLGRHAVETLQQGPWGSYAVRLEMSHSYEVGPVTLLR